MAVITLDRFPDKGLDLIPLAPKVGPFPLAGFLQAWWDEIRPDARMMIVSTGTGVLPLMAVDGVIRFLGDGDLTDYHSPLGPDIDSAVALLANEVEDTVILDFDSLPGEAALPLTESLSKMGFRPVSSEQTIAMVLPLPASTDEYYSILGKKERHELRRKRRRYEDQVGSPKLRTDTGAGFGFEEFIRLHRLAPGEKGGFMTEERLRFFARLAGQEGWRVDYLQQDGVATACLFGWTDGSDYYLYNSCFDPEVQAASPGLVLLVEMIEHAIGEGWGVFDFLKGDEVYKSRLGGVPRQLFQVRATR